jgi:hypothetical protein
MGNKHHKFTPWGELGDATCSKYRHINSPHSSHTYIIRSLLRDANPAAKSQSDRAQCRRRARRRRRRTAAGAAAARLLHASPGAAPSASIPSPPPAGAPSPRRREPSRPPRSPAAYAPPAASPQSMTSTPTPPRRALPHGCRLSASTRCLPYPRRPRHRRRRRQRVLCGSGWSPRD